jgi:4-amino-4-deoxy-L-arabinose transferase-like glycosyltransferase
MSVSTGAELDSPSARLLITHRHTAYALLALVLILNCAIRFHLRNIPLERDEGEYAYAGQLMLEGVPPYKLAYNMKLPGTYAAYALMLALFGQTPSGIHLGLLVVNSVTVFLVFMLALRFAGLVAAVVAAASYALLCLSPSLLGLYGHATHFVVLMAVAGSLLLLRALDKPRRWLFFESGIFFGLAFVMKQPGLLFGVFGSLYLVRTGLRGGVERRAVTERLGVFLTGAALPFAITCLWLWRAGVFKTFWFWTFSYASQYVTNWGLSDGIHRLRTVFPAIMGPDIWIWLIAGVGAIAVIWDQETRPHAFFALGFLLFSFLAVCPGFLFREHYFILMLPAISVLAGIAVSAGIKIFSRRSQMKTFRYVPAVVFLGALGWCFYAQRKSFFEDSPMETSRKIYGGNPFPEAIPVADYIRQHTSKNASIVVLGSEPEIYFYAHRHSATGYIYTYSIMEEQKYALQMQQQMIREIEAARPESLVWVNVKASWLPHEHSEKLILSWAKEYVRDHYEMTGVADIHMSQTDYRWGDDAKNYQPRSNSVVFVFKRTTP